MRFYFKRVQSRTGAVCTQAISWHKIVKVWRMHGTAELPWYYRKYN